MSDEERKAAQRLVEAQRQVIKLSNELIVKLESECDELVIHLRESQEEIDFLRKRLNEVLGELVVEQVRGDLKNKPSLN